MPSLGFRDQKLLYIFSEKKQSTKYIFKYTSIPQMCDEWETQACQNFVFKWIQGLVWTK